MVLLIIIPFLNGYFIGNINPTFSDKPIFSPQQHMNQVGKTKLVEIFEADRKIAAAEIADDAGTRKSILPNLKKTESWTAFCGIWDYIDPNEQFHQLGFVSSNIMVEIEEKQKLAICANIKIKTCICIKQNYILSSTYITYTCRHRYDMPTYV